jgi:hypothetical protein
MAPAQSHSRDERKSRYRAAEAPCSQLDREGELSHWYHLHPFLISWAAQGESSEKALETVPLFGETVTVADSSDDHQRFQTGQM